MSLSDLLKQRTTTNGINAKKFKIPCIFGQNKSTDTSNLSSSLQTPTFNNLSELVIAHLANDLVTNPSQSINIPQQLNGTKFSIPKLNGVCNSSSLSSSENLTPHEMSLKKIMELKRLHISSNVDSITNDIPTTYAKIEIGDANKNENYVVDLTTALNDPGFKSSFISPVKQIAEPIDFKFIDCDIIERHKNVLPIMNKDCNLNLSNILNENILNRTKIVSQFGKILCSRYKCRKQPFVQHSFENKHKIKPFRFDIIKNRSTK